MHDKEKIREAEFHSDYSKAAEMTKKKGGRQKGAEDDGGMLKTEREKLSGSLGGWRDGWMAK